MEEEEKQRIRLRMLELMMPIDKQILMCDSQEELLMLACAMMQRTDEVLVQLLGKDARKKMYQELI